ncbi:MAG TPA: DUF559 domain-containing protein [Candidatus Dormibacteraeota bacterium]
MAHTSPATLQRARQLRRDQTDAEQRLWRLLRNRQINGLRFRRQFPIGPYFVDFACTTRRLVIELDGSQHMHAAAYDNQRTAFLATKGYKVLRFWDNDVLIHPEEVAEAIRLALR